jgi:hypothetical protein
MNKFVLVLITLLVGQNIWATKSLRLDDANDPDFILSSNELYSETAGDGTIITSPFKVYIPINPGTQGTGNQTEYHLFGSSIPGIANTALPIYLDLTSTISGETNMDVYLAFRDSSDTDFEVIKSYGYTLSASTDFGSTSISFNINELCSTSSLDCSSLDDTTGDSYTSEDLVLYFFLATNGSLAVGSSFDPTDTSYNDGIYFEANLSNRIYTSSDLTLALNSIDKGDSTLTLNYSGDTIADFKEVAVYQGITTGSVAWSNSGGNKLSAEDEFPAETDASILVGNLSNDTSYTLAVSFIDKYLFASVISNSLSETPTLIDAFLEKEQCYLLSAGFQESHYVIDYFKMLRDNYLLHNYYGKIFVNFYYATAPNYTRMIYNSPILSQVVRLFGYLAYYVFQFWTLIAAPILFLISRKIMLAKRR